MRYLLLFLIISGFFSCKEEEIKVFEGENGVAFWQNGGTSASGATTRYYNFTTPANREKTKDTVFLDMQISGKITDYARKIKIKTVTAGTTAKAGIHYDYPAEFTLPAGAYRIKYPVIVYKTPEMLTDTLNLVVSAETTSDFIIGATGPIPPKSSTDGSPTVWLVNPVTVLITDVMLQANLGFTWNATIFGTYSSVKYRFMVKETGLTVFTTTALGGTAGANALRDQLRIKLAAYEAVNGPLIAENNDRVTF